MKKKTLEITLQQVPMLPAPTPTLEQYMTPAPIAADIIYTAYQWGDIEHKTIVDLGCGTGIFSVGAYLAGAQKVIGVDIDKNSIRTAKTYAQQNNFDIEFRTQDISQVGLNCDTVLMNPPFGAQKQNLQADRQFLEIGCKISEVVYSLHLKKTMSFLQKLIDALGGKITYTKTYSFPIQWTFSFHTKPKVVYEVVLLRIQTLNDSESASINRKTEKI